MLLILLSYIKLGMRCLGPQSACGEASLSNRQTLLWPPPAQPSITYLIKVYVQDHNRRREEIPRADQTLCRAQSRAPEEFMQHNTAAVKNQDTSAAPKADSCGTPRRKEHLKQGRETCRAGLELNASIFGTRKFRTRLPEESLHRYVQMTFTDLCLLSKQVDPHVEVNHALQRGYRYSSCWSGGKGGSYRLLGSPRRTDV